MLHAPGSAPAHGPLTQAAESRDSTPPPLGFLRAPASSSCAMATVESAGDHPLELRDGVLGACSSPSTPFQVPSLAQRSNRHQTSAKKGTPSQIPPRRLGPGPTTDRLNHRPVVTPAPSTTRRPFRSSGSIRPASHRHQPRPWHGLSLVGATAEIPQTRPRQLSWCRD